MHISFLEEHNSAHNKANGEEKGILHKNLIRLGYKNKRNNNISILQEAQLNWKINMKERMILEN